AAPAGAARERIDGTYRKAGSSGTPGFGEAAIVSARTGRRIFTGQLIRRQRRKRSILSHALPLILGEVALREGKLAALVDPCGDFLRCVGPEVHQQRKDRSMLLHVFRAALEGEQKRIDVGGFDVDVEL